VLVSSLNFFLLLVNNQQKWVIEVLIWDLEAIRLFRLLEVRLVDHQAVADMLVKNMPLTLPVLLDLLRVAVLQQAVEALRSRELTFQLISDLAR